MDSSKKEKPFKGSNLREKNTDVCNDDLHSLCIRQCIKYVIQHEITIALWTMQALDAGSSAGELAHSDERSN